MRHISQFALHVHGLSQANQNPPVTPVQSSSRWSSFGYKPEVLARLLNQQYQLCCYSEVRADLLGLDYHIEHVENKSQVPHRTFDETNLAASALSSDMVSSLIKEDVFGGHAVGKQRGVDMNLFVHCHFPNCSDFFSYLSDGRIVPSIERSEAEQQRAQYTIGLLNLNSPYLVTMRQLWWDELEKLEAEHLSNNWDINQLLQLDIVPTGNHQLNQFFSLTRQFFGPLAEALLQSEAPELL